MVTSSPYKKLKLHWNFERHRRRSCRDGKEGEEETLQDSSANIFRSNSRTVVQISVLHSVVFCG
jgi:hypothetical protein